MLPTSSLPPRPWAVSDSPMVKSSLHPHQQRIHEVIIPTDRAKSYLEWSNFAEVDRSTEHEALAEVCGHRGCLHVYAIVYILCGNPARYSHFTVATLSLSLVSGFAGLLGFYTPQYIAEGKSYAEITHLMTYPTLFMSVLFRCWNAD